MIARNRRKTKHQVVVDRALGKKIDTDGYYGGQCVDWVCYYKQNVYGEKKWHGNAGQRWKLGPREGRRKIKNISGDLTNYPKKGDILYWLRGKYGHVAIVHKATPHHIRVIEQNGVGNNKKLGRVSGDGKDGNAVRIKKYTYRGVVGRFRHHTNESKPQPVSNQFVTVDTSVLNARYMPRGEIKAQAKEGQKLQVLSVWQYVEGETRYKVLIGKDGFYVSGELVKEVAKPAENAKPKPKEDGDAPKDTQTPNEVKKKARLKQKIMKMAEARKEETKLFEETVLLLS